MESQLKNKFSEERYPRLRLGKEFPQIELIDIHQNKTEIGTKSKLTLLTFWDVTCKPCIEELIVFNILANEYPEVIFLALTTNTLQNVNVFLQERGFDWKNLIIIPDCNKYPEIPEIETFPLNVLINGDRIIKKVSMGKSIRDMLLSFEDFIEKDIN